MKRLRYLPFIVACALLLSSCNAAQPVPPWEADTTNAQPTETSAAAGVHGTAQNSANASPAGSAQAGDYLSYQDLYDRYVKNGETVPCDYKDKKLEVLVEITGTEGAVVSCPVVVGLDGTDIEKPRDSKENNLIHYEIALSDQFSLDTHLDKSNDDPEVRKVLEKLAYGNRQLVKKEFGYQYDWQVWEDAGPESRRIKKLPAELLAS